MKNEESSYSTVSVHLAALYHFFSINDVIINRKKLSKFLGEQENKYEYRSYTHDEISSLLSLCDERGKAIVLLMTSTGMKVGALPSLTLRHLTRYDLEDGKYVYRIQVYATSRKDSYFTFCTPECAKAIDSYLFCRKRVDKS
jgi:integrase